MESYGIGVRGYGRRFSLTDAIAECAAKVRVVVYTGSPVSSPSVSYGGIPMACVDNGRHRAPDTEHHYEILNPPIGTQLVAGVFDRDDIYYEVRRIVSELNPAALDYGSVPSTLNFGNPLRPIGFRGKDQ